MDTKKGLLKCNARLYKVTVKTPRRDVLCNCRVSAANHENLKCCINSVLFLLVTTIIYLPKYMNKWKFRDV